MTTPVTFKGIDQAVERARPTLERLASELWQVFRLGFEHLGHHVSDFFQRQHGCGQWVQGEMAHAIEHWRSQFRGIAPQKEDRKLDENDITSSNLILDGTLFLDMAGAPAPGAVLTIRSPA